MISCDLHDYVEIACTYRYELRLLLKSGLEVEGRAIDTVLNADRLECIKIEANKDEILVTLDSVQSMISVSDSPHFKRIDFS